jgi:hypothetical protein
MESLKSSLAVLAMAVAAFGCAAVSDQGRNWMTPTTDMNVGVLEHSLPASKVMEVAAEQRASAVALLETKSWLAITPKEAGKLIGHERSGLILARAVRFSDRSYGISAYYRNGVLFVLTGGMGAGTVAVQKSAVVVDLQRPIKRTYVNYSVDL